jgi:hypothetical protein
MASEKSEQILRKLEQHLPAPPVPESKPEKDIDDDYEFSRKTYRELVDKSNTAIESMLELASSSEHPRAFEVLSGMLKNTADMTQKLMDLQKDKRDLKAPKNNPQGATPSLTQNNTFIGTTKDLQQKLIEKLKVDNASILPNEEP